jgi:hypothetical protein
MERASDLDDVTIYVRIVREHDQWYAEATDYQVVGVGESREAAIQSLRRSMRAYLRAVQRHGGDARNAQRPPGRRARLRVRTLALLTALAPERRRRALRISL